MMKYPFCLHGNPQMQAEARRLRTPIRDGYELPSGVLILTNLCLKFDRLIITSVLFKTKNKGKNASFSKLGIDFGAVPRFQHVHQ